MMIYSVKNTPVAVRDGKTASAPIVNIIPINGKIFVNSIEEGWLKLHNGFYVFETDNLVLETLNEETTRNVQMQYAGPTSEVKLNFALQKFANEDGTEEQYMLPNDDPTRDIDFSGATGDWKNTNVDIKKDNDKITGVDVSNNKEEEKEEEETSQASTDQSQNTEENKKIDDANSIKALNEKYANKPCALDKGSYVFATDGNGNVRKDSNGQEIRWTYDEFMAAYPDSTLFESTKSVCELESINAQGIARVRDNSNGNIFMVDASHLNVNMTPGSTNQWERISLTEGIYKARARADFISSLTDALTKSLSSIVDSFIGINKINIHMINRIHGYPYQFLPWVDNRYNDVDSMKIAALGRKFAEKIVARAPIFSIRAGVPQFMKGYDGLDKASVIKEVAGLGGSVLSTFGFKDNQLKQLSQVLESDGKYYSFRPAPHEYFTAINPVLRYIAVLLNIGDVELPSFQSFSSEEEMKDKNAHAIYQKLADMNWEYMIEHTISGAYTGAVYFYINSDAQISESFSNATRPSEIAGRVNNISDKAAEIQFLLGGAMGAVGASWLTSGLGKEGEDLLNSFKYSGLGGDSNNMFGLGSSTGAGIFNSLIKNLSTMVSGSKMIFPEIWADSNFGRSYNVTIKLVSPDCDRLSIYLNIFVPLVHLLGFVLPRSTASNAYTSPFLVQCWYKSMFHIDLGMITSCDIVKGETGGWTEEGLPTQVTVQLQIKDLYQVLSQASGVNGNHILSNPAQMDYFANLCGVNIHATDVIRTVTLWYTMLNNGLQDDLLSIPTNTLRSISRSFFNLFP